MAMGVIPTAAATRRMVTASVPCLSKRRRAALAILSAVVRASMYTLYTSRSTKARNLLIASPAQKQEEDVREARPEAGPAAPLRFPIGVRLPRADPHRVGTRHAPLPLYFFALLVCSRRERHKYHVATVRYGRQRSPISVIFFSEGSFRRP